MQTRTTARCHFTPARTGHRRGTDPAGGDARGTAAPHGRCRAPSGPLPGPTPRGPKPRPRGNLPRAPTAAPLAEPRCPPTGNETGGHGTGPGAAPLSPPAACRDTGDVPAARRAREARHASTAADSAAPRRSRHSRGRPQSGQGSPCRACGPVGRSPGWGPSMFTGTSSFCPEVLVATSQDGPRQPQTGLHVAAAPQSTPTWPGSPAGTHKPGAR